MFYSKSTGGFYDPAIHGANMPPDIVEISDDDHALLMRGQTEGRVIAAAADGRPVLVNPPPPTQEQVVAAFTAAIQKRLDDFALTRRYDNVSSLSKYSNLTDAEITSLPVEDRPAATRYRTECRYLLLKTAQTWAVGERILAQVQTNVRPMPASIADIQAELPALVWPV